MAMRPRGGGDAGSRRTTRSGVVRPVYEDFKPVSEWQQDDESHILNIYLPGFAKEQIRVSTEGRNTIRVRGERLVAGNKWSRFLEDFQVPENGEMNSVRAKFHGGILSITVPKEKVGKPQEAALIPETTKEAISQPTKDVKGGMETQAQRGEDGKQKGGLHTESGASQSTGEKASDEPYNYIDDDQKGRSFTPLKTTRNEISHEKKDAGERASVDHDMDGDQRGRSFTPTPRAENVIFRNGEKAKEKQVAPEKPEDVTKGSELPETKKNKSEKSEATSIPSGNKDSYGALKKQNYNKAMEGLNKERQLLVNMGASLLVIVALTAYVTYSFTSAKHKN